MSELKSMEDWVKLIQTGCQEIRKPPYEGIPAPLPKCNITGKACRFDNCPKRGKEEYIPCEFAAMHDCSKADVDGETCRIYKDPQDCETYHRKMVAEGEETPEEFEAWKKTHISSEDKLK